MFAKFLSNSLKNANTDDIVQKMQDGEAGKDSKNDDKKQRKEKSKKKKREKSTRPKSPPLDSLKKLERVSQHTGLDSLGVAKFENMMMADAEKEQVGVDTFWGLDHEEMHRQFEESIMIIEDKRSSKFEKFLSTNALINRWEEDEFFIQQKQALKDSIVESVSQQNYLRAIYDGSIYDVTNYKWPTHPTVAAREGQSPSKQKKVGDEFLRSLYSLESTYGFPMEISTVHTEGMSHSQVMMNPKLERSLLFKERNVEQKEAGNKPKVIAEAEAEAMKELYNYDPMAKTRHDALDGHPVHRWDQEAVLKSAFHMLDKKVPNKRDSNGMLNFTQVSRVMGDRAIHRHLRYTIMGAWIKLKSAEMFRAMFTNNIYLDEEDIVNEISIVDWIEACRSAVYEESILPRQIRTLEEHSELVLAASPWGSGLQTLSKHQFAELTRKIQYRSHRDSRLMREVREGDLVWGLYGGACEWLPASIEAVNDDGTFDVKYLLTETEIQAARAATISRKLLTAASSDEKEISLEPLHFDNEKQLVEKVFDLIDESKVGVVNAKELLEQLQSTKFEKVVHTSSCLSLLIEADVDILQDLLLASAGCSGSTELREDGVKMMSKVEFVEFCSVLADIRVFNFVE